MLLLFAKLRIRSYDVGIETQVQYFVAKSEGLEGIDLSIFYAPLTDKLVIPKEVLRARGMETVARSSLWKILTDDLSSREFNEPTLEPSSIEQVGNSIEIFLRSQSRVALYVDEDSPSEIKETLQIVAETLDPEDASNLASFLGLGVSTTINDDQLLRGQYL